LERLHRFAVFGDDFYMRAYAIGWARELSGRD